MVNFKSTAQWTICVYGKIHRFNLKSMNDGNAINILQAMEIKEELDLIESSDQIQIETDELEEQQVRCIIYLLFELV